MLQAIRTRYLGPTNYKPGRIVASAPAGKVTLEYDHALRNADANHRRAAEALAERYGWTGERYGPLVAGGLDNKGNVYVFAARGGPEED